MWEQLLSVFGGSGAAPSLGSNLIGANAPLMQGGGLQMPSINNLGMGGNSPDIGGGFGSLIGGGEIPEEDGVLSKILSGLSGGSGGQGAPAVTKGPGANEYIGLQGLLSIVNALDKGVGKKGQSSPGTHPYIASLMGGR